MKLITFIAAFLFAVATYAQTSTAAHYIDTFSKNHHFNGTILLSNNGKTVFHKSFGLANVPFSVPNTTDTRYKVASITKAFTAVLILQLYEEGKLDLHKTINAYLPDYKGQAGNKATVEQLLNMTSGIHNMDAGTSMELMLTEGIPQYQKPRTSSQMLTLYASDTLENEPGKKFDYNNAEYIILGKIIEKLSGKNFEQQLKDKILIPLQMPNSGMAYSQEVISKLANTYYYRDDKGSLANDFPMYIENWYAAGAMYSTTSDLIKFCNALFGKKLLKQSTLDLMFHSGLGEYGYGVWVYLNYDIHGTNYTIVKRPGSILGAQAMLFHIRELNSTIIILCNTLNVSMDEFAANIAEKWVGKKGSKP